MTRYNQGLRTALAFFPLMAAVCIRSVFSLFITSRHERSRTIILLDSLQIIAALVCFLECLSIPRRPTVSEGKQAVDGQYTVSALSSYTFGWAGKVLSLARDKKSLDLDDLPKLHLWGRAAYLLRYFSAMTRQNDRLWKSLIFAHWPELLFQTVWAVMQSILQFAPQLVMYQLLRLLEDTSQHGDTQRKAWFLVMALGASIILASVSCACEDSHLFSPHVCLTYMT